MTDNCQLVWPTQAQLGEGPIWSQDTATLHYVDIKGGAIHRYHPQNNTHRSTPFDGRPSFIVPVAGGRFLVGSGDGLFLYDEGGQSERVATVDMPSHNRTNDATVDCHGRLWFGTMDDEEAQPTGALYCLADGRVQHMGGAAVVTNGPAVSRDGRTLYHVDSGNRTVWRYAIGDGPSLGEPELFLRLKEDEGYPDGVVLDSEDCLWVALWDGWGVHRYAPDARLLQRIDLPCARVTKVAFGGEDLRTLFITTARIGLDEQALAEQPSAGGLFRHDSAVAGLPLPAVKL